MTKRLLFFKVASPLDNRIREVTMNSLAFWKSYMRMWLVSAVGACVIALPLAWSSTSGWTGWLLHCLGGFAITGILMFGFLRRQMHGHVAFDKDWKRLQKLQERLGINNLHLIFVRALEMYDWYLHLPKGTVPARVTEEHTEMFVFEKPPHLRLLPSRGSQKEKVGFDISPREFRKLKELQELAGLTIIEDVAT